MGELSMFVSVRMCLYEIEEERRGEERRGESDLGGLQLLGKFLVLSAHICDLSLE